MLLIDMGSLAGEVANELTSMAAPTLLFLSACAQFTEARVADRLQINALNIVSSGANEHVRRTGSSEKLPITS